MRNELFCYDKFSWYGPSLPPLGYSLTCQHEAPWARILVALGLNLKFFLLSASGPMFFNNELIDDSAYTTWVRRCMTNHALLRLWSLFYRCNFF